MNLPQNTSDTIAATCAGMDAHSRIRGRVGGWPERRMTEAEWAVWVRLPEENDYLLMLIAQRDRAQYRPDCCATVPSFQIDPFSNRRTCTHIAVRGDELPR